VIAWLRVNSRAGWAETIHAPLPSAAASLLNRAVAMIAPPISRAMKLSETWIAIV
jgi:2-keto-3-deoxy-galactonokinase